MDAKSLPLGQSKLAVEVYINCKLMETKLPNEYKNRHYKHAGPANR